MIDKFKLWASKLKSELTAIYIASRDARTPRVAKYLAIAVAAYAFSPVDLIPDFIPMLGLLDDLIIILAGIALIVRLIPQDLMASFRREATTRCHPSSNWLAAGLIIVLWLVMTVVFMQFIFGFIAAQ